MNVGERLSLLLLIKLFSIDRWIDAEDKGVKALSQTPPVVQRAFVLFVQLVVAGDCFSTRPADVFLLQTTQRGLQPTWKDTKQNTFHCVFACMNLWMWAWFRSDPQNTSFRHFQSCLLIQTSESDVCQKPANEHKLDSQEVFVCRLRMHKTHMQHSV